MGFNILRAIRDGRVTEGVRLLRAERFFDDEEVRQAATDLETALIRVDAVLQTYTAAAEVAKALLTAPEREFGHSSGMSEHVDDAFAMRRTKIR
jgi:hypothetical protein